ncbi:MAG TPA: sterol desaturase family protein [Polyangiaceae bacterium]|nr:sterol desaturase family protein [Polyangiaceae bacterium]
MNMIPTNPPEVSPASRRPGQAEPTVFTSGLSIFEAQKAATLSGKITSARGVSPRMFDTELFERFSRAHPATPALVYGPMAIGAIAYAIHLGQGIARVSVAVLLGYVAWTFAEYWLHRVVFHLRVVGPKTARVHFVLHGVHHEYPWDFSRLVMPLGASSGLCVLTYALFRLLLGPVQMWAPFAGFLLGYIFYDSVHWYVHARKPKRGILGWIRREHFLHHFRNPESRYGVSCPWMDTLFRSRGPAVGNLHVDA